MNSRKLGIPNGRKSTGAGFWFFACLLLVGLMGCDQGVREGARRNVMGKSSLDTEDTAVDEEESQSPEVIRRVTVSGQNKSQSAITMDVDKTTNERQASKSRKNKAIDDAEAKLRVRILRQTLAMHSSNLFDASFDIISEVTYHKLDHTKVVVRLIDGRNYTVSAFFDEQAVNKIQIFETGKVVYLNQ